MKLTAAIGLDTREYDQGVDHAVSEAKRMAPSLGKSLAMGAKIVAKGVAAAAGAVATVTGMAIKNYAEYEQLVGGVETLFKDSAGAVQEYAANAYKTAGMSANDYMATVTSFSASLLQSLDGDTAAAAQKADVAITDMSDNANKMGTDISMIQNAYQGFAKQNFMMLDNLKLGYGGTKEEMERLLTRANELNAEQGIITDYQIESYADIVDAIHVVQTELGISGISAEEAAELVASGAMTEEEAFELLGTTAKEASTTIQGSLLSAKAAFSNLVTGVADDNADFNGLIDDFVGSVGTAAGNILPRVEIALQGIAALIERVMPMVAQKIPELVLNVLPGLISAGAAIVSSLSQGILEALPEIIATGVEILTGLIESITADPGRLVETAIQLIMTLATGLIGALPQIIASGVELVVALIEGIITHLPDILMAALEIINALEQGLVDLFWKLTEVGNDIIEKIKEGISNAWDGLKNWFNNLWDGLFGNRKVSVDVEHSEDDNPPPPPPKAGGMHYVPYDGYSATLHEGEMVLTRREAKAYRSGDSTPTVNNFYINALPQTPAEIADVVKSCLEQARWTLA